MGINSLIRYPGSKAKLYKIIHSVLPDHAALPLQMYKLGCYCEPFIGSGAIAWNVLNTISEHTGTTRVLLGDFDPYIARLWQVIRDTPGDLIDMVESRTPDVHDFERFKKLDGSLNTDVLVSAYRKLVLHQTSWSGLGAMAGSVLGGKSQRSEYNHLCRWNPVRIVSRIKSIHSIMSGFGKLDILHADFAETLSLVPANGLAYLDPPYYQQGEALYKHNLSDDDHVRLAAVLKAARYRFVLSYDDHQRIRELYEWATITPFLMTPTIQETKKPRRKNQELLITNF